MPRTNAQLQITPPPGFGGPISNGPTPSVSNHTSIDSAAQLAEAAEAARLAGVRVTGAAAAGEQPGPEAAGAAEGYSPFSAFGAAAGVGTVASGGSLFSSLGSSGSLMERLPSAGDLLAPSSNEVGGREVDKMVVISSQQEFEGPGLKDGFCALDYAFTSPMLSGHSQCALLGC